MKIREKFTQDSGFLASPFFDRFFGDIPEEKTKQVRGSMRRLFVSSIKLAKSLKQNYSEKELDEALKVLDEASTKLEEIRNKIKGEEKDVTTQLAAFLKEKTGGEVSNDNGKMVVKSEALGVKKKYVKVLLNKFLHHKDLKGSYRVVSG